MENQRIMNVLVLGRSGAGKSTLIEAIAGAKTQANAAGSAARDIEVYESSTWPLRILDTKEFDNIFEQLKAIYQINKYAREQSSSELTDEDDGSGIDAVWYCVDGSGKISSGSIDMMNMAVKKLKNVPVFVALTKSVSDSDAEENVKALREQFAKNKNINLCGIFPVVAKAYEVRGEIEAAPKGVEELCSDTLDRFDTAHQISRENRELMKLEQKRFTANTLIAGAAAAGVVVGAVPSFPVADSAILVPLETGLTKGILKVYNIGTTGDLIAAVIGSTAITNVAKAAVSTLKTIPNVAGSVINAAVAGVFVTAIGEAVVALSEAIHSGKLDQNKMDAISEFIGSKLTDNKMVGSSVRYINDNADKLQGKSAKQIFEMLKKAVGGKDDRPDLSAPSAEAKQKTGAKKSGSDDK